MANAHTLYERVWGEPPPVAKAGHRAESQSLNGVERERLPRGIQKEGRILFGLQALDVRLSEVQAMCDGLKNQSSTTESLDLLGSGRHGPRQELQTHEVDGPYHPESGLQERLEREVDQRMAQIGAHLERRLGEIQSELDRRIQSYHSDIVHRIEGLEATIQNRDINFIESLVTLIELSWRWSWEGQPQTGGPAVAPST